MAKKKDEAVRKKIHALRLQEAVNAVIYVLQEHEKRFPGTTLPKPLLLERIPKAILVIRKDRKGFQYIPSVDNVEVAVASRSFVRNNWTEICLTAAEYGYFVIWNPPDEKPGVRLGTLVEYERQQSLVLAVTAGMAEYHNRRSAVIEQHGERSTDVDVRVRPRKAREEK